MQTMNQLVRMSRKDLLKKSMTPPSITKELSTL